MSANLNGRRRYHNGRRTRFILILHSFFCSVVHILLYPKVSHVGSLNWRLPVKFGPTLYTSVCRSSSILPRLVENPCDTHFDRQYQHRSRGGRTDINSLIRSICRQRQLVFLFFFNNIKEFYVFFFVLKFHIVSFSRYTAKRGQTSRLL